MSDFCQQCCAEILGMDNGLNDLSNLVSEKESEEGWMATALCEGCGPIQVDHEGKCLSKDCLKEHGERPTKDKDE